MNAPTGSAYRPSSIQSRAALAILAGGLAAGTLDVGAAALPTVSWCSW